MLRSIRFSFLICYINKTDFAFAIITVDMGAMGLHFHGVIYQSISRLATLCSFVFPAVCYTRTLLATVLPNRCEM